MLRELEKPKWFTQNILWNPTTAKFGTKKPFDVMKRKMLRVV